MGSTEGSTVSPAQTDSDAQSQMASIYRFLATSMHYPDSQWLNDNYWTALKSLLQSLNFINEITELNNFFPVNQHSLETLQIEHTRLFINAIPSVLAPPYGSIYLSNDGMLMGKSTEETTLFYRENGFDLSDPSMIPDHIIYELDFLGLLSESGRSEQENLFLQRHFRPWFEEFQQRVLTNAEQPFYRVIVRLIDFFIKEEE